MHAPGVFIFDVASGRLERSLPFFDIALSVSFSPDGRRVLVANAGIKNGALSAFDVQSGKKLWTETHAGPAHYVSEDLIVGADYSSGSWQVVQRAADGRLLRAFDGGRVVSAIAPDGRYAVIRDAKGNQLLDLTNGTVLWHKDLWGEWSFSSDSALVVWRKVEVSGKHQPDVVFDARTGEALQTLGGAASRLRPEIAASAQIFTLEEERVLVWTLRDGSLGKRLGDSGGVVEDFAVSQNDRFVAVRTARGLSLWDLRAEAVTRSLDAAVVALVDVSDAGVVTYDDPDNARLAWDGVSSEGTGDASIPAGAARSADGRTALVGGNDNSARLMRPDGSALLLEAPAATVTEREDEYNPDDTRTWTHSSASMPIVALSPDGKLALGASTDGVVRVWSVDSGARVGTLRYRAGRKEGALVATAAAFSPDSKWVAVGTSKSQLFVARAIGRDSAKKPFRLTSKGPVASVAYTPDGKRLLVASGGLDDTNRFTAFDVASGKASKPCDNGVERPRPIRFLRDGRSAIVVDDARILALWNLERCEPLALLASGSDWLIHTRDGYFDASRTGGDLVAMVQGMRAFGVEQFAAQYNRPDLVAARFGLGDAEWIAHFRARVEKRFLALGIKEAKPAALEVPEAHIVKTEKNGRSLRLQVTFAGRERDLKRYDVYANGVPIFGTAGKPLSGRTATLSVDVELLPGVNRIEVSCGDDVGAESFRDSTVIAGEAAAPGKLFVIAFGVSKYADSALDLGFAHKDAQDLARALSKAQGFSAVETFVRVDRDVNAEQIKAAKRLLATASAQDTVVLFIAGHGLHDDDDAAHYYYLVHGSKPNDLAGTAVTFEFIEDLLDGIAPRRKLFFMDTCDSGNLEDNARVTRALAGARGLKVRKTAAASTKVRPYLFSRDRLVDLDLARRTGAIVFSSSRGGEPSFESSELQNGQFTHAVLAALRDATADEDGDRRVSVDELRNFVSATVAKSTGDAQHPTVDRDNVNLRIDLPALP